jgi:hypothetical protein
MSGRRLIRWAGSVQRWHKPWQPTVVAPAITHRNSPIPPKATAMAARSGSMAVNSRKLRERSLLIEWMVLLIQNTRADASHRKMSAQGKTPVAQIFVRA